MRSEAMLDFTSALYLGLQHPLWSLRPWTRLTTGKPAALGTPESQARLGHALARLQGCEKATLAASTLHLFWDLFGVLAKSAAAIYMDTGAYAITQWAVAHAAARGVPVRIIPFRQPQVLRPLLERDARSGLRPVVVADGFYPGVDGPTPIAAYLEAVRAYGGQLILDDTQAMGIFGHSPGPDAPYGREGGGSLRHVAAGGPETLVVSSLAKGFGVPIAVLAGSAAAVRNFKAYSQTRVHCSPPSAAVIHAAEHALAINARWGDHLRLRLAQRVRYFRRRLEEIGLSAAGGLFPVQTLTPVPGLEATSLYSGLLQSGIRTVLQRRRNGQGSCVSFLITALHRRRDIHHAVEEIARIRQRALVPWKMAGREALPCFRSAPRHAEAITLEVSHELQTQYRVGTV
jgi:8-amino-7-oxononanoate synthase